MSIALAWAQEAAALVFLGEVPLSHRLDILVFFRRSAQGPVTTSLPFPEHSLASFKLANSLYGGNEVAEDFWMDGCTFQSFGKPWCIKSCMYEQSRTL
jgi:hypothetical protein